MTPTNSHCVYSVQKLLQKYRRHRLRLLRKKEYNRLRAMVPSIATKPKVSKVTVIEEAIKYIDHLHSALIARLQTRGLPQALRGLGLQPQDIQRIDRSEIRELVRRILPSNQQRQPTAPSPTGYSVVATRERSRHTSSRKTKWPRH